MTAIYKVDVTYEVYWIAYSVYCVDNGKLCQKFVISKRVMN